MRQRRDESAGVCELCGAHDFGVGGIGPAEADIVAYGSREHHAVLRHQRDARAQLRRIEIGKANAVERDAAGGRIVEAQQQMEDRALAGAGRSDDGDLLALADMKRYAVEGGDIGPCRIGEPHVLENHLAARRRRQRKRLRRRNDRGLDGENFEQPLRRAGSLRHFAAGLRQRAECASGEHSIKDELPEPAGSDRAGQHVLVADPQHEHDACGYQKHRERGQDGARADRIARRGKGALHCASKLRDAEPLVGEGLQHPHGADQFRGIGRSVGERILSEARAAAHRAAERVKRQHDDRDRAKHESRQPRAGHHHHGAGADEQHEIAQCHGHRSADRGLDLGGVGGEPRDQFAGPRRIEECGGERGEMGEHVAAQIGDNALAKRGDEVVARRARQRQHGDDADHHQIVTVDEVEPLRA